MNGVLHHFRRPRSRVILLAAILALTAQAVATLLAPIAEARASHNSAPAHVETEGTHQHHTHNPADCAACIALQLTGIPQRAVRGAAVPIQHGAAHPPAALHVVAASRFDDRNSRAPPTSPA